MFLIVFLIMLGCLGYGILNLFKKKFKKGFILLGSTVVLFVIWIFLAPDTVSLSLKEATISTDEDGIAIISGETNKNASLTLEDKKISIDADGSFSVAYQLEKNEDSVLNISANYKDSEISKKVSVQPSQLFRKKLIAQEEKAKEEETRKLQNEKQSKEKVAIETALVLAESEPTKTNYEAVKKLIDDYSNDDKESFNARLQQVNNTLKIAGTTEKAETAIALAESSISRENYQAAVSALDKLSEKPNQLSQRLNDVNNQLTQIEAEEQQAILAKEAEQHHHDEVTEAPHSEIVLVTPTGSKYHNRKCGNGTYTEATLDEAKAGGLTACRKCY